MNLRTILATSATAALLPFAASAATLQIDGVEVEDYEAGTTYQIDVGGGDGATVNSTYREGDEGTYMFEIMNSLSGGKTVITFVDGTINQGQSFGFYSGADSWVSGEDKGGLAGLEIMFGDETLDLDAGEKGFLEFDTVLDADDSVMLSFTFDGVKCVGNNLGGCPDIDFVVSTTPVPLPAAGFLLLGAMGGLVAMRKKKS